RHLDPSSPAYERLVASKELARAGLGWVRSAVEELSGLEQPGTDSSRRCATWRRTSAPPGSSGFPSG
ncbi:MAG: hypothetical protein ACRDP7_29775, partial [Trebonia sp.]